MLTIFLTLDIGAQLVMGERHVVDVYMASTIGVTVLLYFGCTAVFELFDVGAGSRRK